MRVRWSIPAADDLEQICEWIEGTIRERLAA